jgi:hypothetical protein
VARVAELGLCLFNVSNVTISILINVVILIHLLHSSFRATGAGYMHIQQSSADYEYAIFALYCVVACPLMTVSIGELGL